MCLFFFQAEDGIRDGHVTGVQTCALPIWSAGLYMTPEVIALPENLTVARALQVVRAKGEDAETVYTLPIVDTSRRLRGRSEERRVGKGCRWGVGAGACSGRYEQTSTSGDT